MARLFLGSGGYGTPERLAVYREAMREHFGSIERVLFVPHAIADHDGYVRGMTERGYHGDYELVGLHTFDDPVAAVESAQGVYVGGGNSFRLVDALQRLGVVEPLRARVAAGLPYMGVSAGSNAACPTLMTTNDMPIVQPASFEALGLVPFQINPHYFAGSTWVRAGEELVEHRGETRDQRIAEYHEENERVVVGLWEGAGLRVDGERVTLVGGPARVFERGREPRDHEAGARLDELLG